MKNTIRNLKSKLEMIAANAADSLEYFMRNHWVALIVVSQVIEILWWARRF